VTSTLMTPEQRQELERELAGVYPAAAELVLDAVRAERAARAPLTPTTADMARIRAVAAVPQMAKRLLQAEAEYARMRAVLARILHEHGAGDDYQLSDLAWELEQAGLSVRAEMEEAADLACGEAMGALR